MFGREWPDPDPVSLGFDGAPRQHRECAMSEATDQTGLYGSVLVTCVRVNAQAAVTCLLVTPTGTQCFGDVLGWRVHLHHLFEDNLMCCKNDRGPGGHTSLSYTPLLSDFHIGTSSLPPMASLLHFRFSVSVWGG